MLALLLLGASPAVSAAQSSSAGSNDGLSDARWRVSGEVGGVFGGKWLTGVNVPHVSTDAGLALSVALHRQTSSRVSPGLSLRGAMQAITMDEAGTQWSGGTATDAQLLGTVAVALRSSGTILSDLEFGGGAAFLAGTREVFPFSEASRVAVVGEVGLVLSLGSESESVYRYKPFALVVRYGVLGIDPAGGPANLPNSMSTSPGWIGRTTVALRYRP